MWEQGPKGRTTEKVREAFFMQHIKCRCFCRTDKDVLNFVLSIIDSPPEELGEGNLSLCLVLPRMVTLSLIS